MSYLKATKCGRYGAAASDFDYSRETIRASIKRSLERLGTTYLDVVFLHDTEFVCTPVHPDDPTGDPTKALEDESLGKVWGLGKGLEGQVHGEGDQKILDAFDELKKMKEEGLIREIGLTGQSIYRKPCEELIGRRIKDIRSLFCFGSEGSQLQRGTHQTSSCRIPTPTCRIIRSRHLLPYCSKREPNNYSQPPLLIWAI